MTARGAASQRAKSGYAAALHATGRGLRRARVLPEAAPTRDRRWRHWAHSLVSVHDSAALAALDVPWWTYDAIDAVEAFLAARPRPARVFEYGAGASTVWLARRAGEVHSVEHDAPFADRLRGLLPPDTVSLHVVAPEPEPVPRTPSGKAGFAALDFTDYVHAIDAVDGELDLLVVDGRARSQCLLHGLTRLRSDGLVVFDNSRRRRYRPAIAASGLDEQLYRGLTPTLPYPDQTSLLCRRRPPH